MLYENIWQRFALDSDRMMITQFGKDYHDYSETSWLASKIGR